MRNNFFMLGASSLVLAMSIMSSASAQDGVEKFIKDGKVFGEIRYRNEHVEQDNALDDANAHTIRANVGFKTGEYNGLQGLIEAQFVRHMGDEEFNTTSNGQTTYSTVADPDIEQINRVWLAYSGVPDTVIKVGRQAINLDNQRFVGTVGWRQNDQTFDAATVTNTSLDKVEAQYSYVANVNRVFDEGAQQDDLHSAVHLANVTYDHADWLRATAYGYWMDFEDAAALSNKTFGLRLAGKAPINDDWTFAYEVEYADQEDHADNTNSYDEGYYHIAPSVSGHGLTFKLGYEVLEGSGNANQRFQTPLATLHKFNGWADAFLSTPADGLEDMYGLVSYKVSGTNTPLDGAKAMAVYHSYEGEEANDFGDEWDFSLGKTFALPDAGQPFKKVNVLLKYADYDADGSAPAGYNTDTEKVWLQVGVKF